MGFWRKVINGKKRHFKVCKRCACCQDKGVKIVTSMSGEDLKDVFKSDNDTIVKKVYKDCCDKCEFIVDELSLEDLGRAKKIFETVEID